ncbi:glutathione S-transferase family protein [Magnetofaba australis]|uniref:Putative glutathione S-transferase n=1 Tax=Magnetofaba australis IT-1 TaxID=1434232 RepID=A0A1Y2JZS6_9PROT|nr:glutathione S-transferase [Magnetofaba australis]OSM00425.1 putative glutathione S-transferase [Magnetofaba australis IT-1]
MMTFYMTPGSCSTGIHVLLEELELVFSAHVLNLPAGEHRQADYLAINPKGTIPTLVLDDGRALTDFASIAWHLATSHPRAKLLPQDPVAQAESIGLINHIVGEIHGQGFARVFTTDRFALRTEDHEAIIAQGRQRALEGLEIVAQRLQSTPGPWFYDHFTVADCALFYVTFWARHLEMPMPQACREHLDAMLQRPTARQVLMEEGYRI